MHSLFIGTLLFIMTDIVFQDHEQKICLLMHMAMQSDENITVKEYVKISKYKNLEIKKIGTLKLLYL